MKKNSKSVKPVASNIPDEAVLGGPLNRVMGRSYSASISDYVAENWEELTGWPDDSGATEYKLYRVPKSAPVRQHGEYLLRVSTSWKIGPDEERPMTFEDTEAVGIFHETRVSFRFMSKLEAFRMFVKDMLAPEFLALVPKA